MSHLPIGATPENPQYVSLDLPTQMKVRVATMGDVQAISGPGRLSVLFNTEQQDITIWDFDGVGPIDSDLIADFKLITEGPIQMRIGFVNGIRVNTQGKGIIIHYTLD